MRRPRALALLAAVIVATGAACGGGGGGVDDADLGLDSTAPTTGAGEARSPEEERAERINLTLDDLPIDQPWTREPAAARDLAADRRFAECLGQDYDAANRAAEVDSDSFEGPGGLVVASTVLIRTEEAGAEASFATLHAEGAPECVKQQLDDQLSDTPGVRSNVERLEPPAVGDDVAGFRYRAAGTVDLVVDTVFVRVGDVTFNLGFVGQSEPAPATLERDLAETMAARARG